MKKDKSKNKMFADALRAQGIPETEANALEFDIETTEEQKLKDKLTAMYGQSEVDPEKIKYRQKYRLKRNY